jgi:hypothetical protein
MARQVSWVTPPLPWDQESGHPALKNSEGYVRSSGLTCATVNPRDKSPFRKFGNAAIFPKWLYRLLIHAQSLCNPVLGDAKAVHAEYLDVKVHLVFTPTVSHDRRLGSPFS